MTGRIFTFWDELRSSYWFLPGTLSLAAAALAVLLVGVDRSGLAGEWMADVPWLFANRPEGARELLSTIAGSMITVAGVTFSITIVAVATVTSHFGPRVINTFMRDRGNQLTLATLIATFIYCVLVLRTIQSAEEAAETFVPQLAVLGALALALLSVGVLIYFIHHVPLTIHASHVVAEIGQDLLGKLDHIFPEPLASGDQREEDGPAVPPVPDDLAEGSREVGVPTVGYIQHIDQDALLELAVERDLLVEVRLRPGSFAHGGSAVARVYPAERVDGDVERAVGAAVKLGRRRTQTQDALFLVDELVEVAGRALSPGVNDPFTAVTCIDWIGAGLVRLARRPPPRPFRYDDRGRLRLLAPVTDFPVVAEEALGRLRPYFERDRTAALRMMEVIGEVMRCVRRDEDRQALVVRADALLRGGQTALPHEEDREALRWRHRRVVAGDGVGGPDGTEVAGGLRLGGGGPRVDAPRASD